LLMHPVMSRALHNNAGIDITFISIRDQNGE
jgi:hypothetical protein